MTYIQITGAFAAHFRAQTAGSVTTDFIILAASIIGIAVTAMGPARDGSAQVALNDRGAVVAID